MHIVNDVMAAIGWVITGSMTCALITGRWLRKRAEHRQPQ